MKEDEIIYRLLEVGINSYYKDITSFTNPQDDSKLSDIGVAAIAGWLEELGKLQLVGKVQPGFGKDFQPTLVYQVTEEAVNLWGDKEKLYKKLKPILPQTNEVYDVFISHTDADSHIAEELRNELTQQGLSCFMAKKDVRVTTNWNEDIRQGLISSRYVLILLTRRSLGKPWILLETGAAWILGKKLIPALNQVDPSELSEPIKLHQARIIETTEQRIALAKELASI